jgi:hypothetical protein
MYEYLHWENRGTTYEYFHHFHEEWDRFQFLALVLLILFSFQIEPHRQANRNELYFYRLGHYHSSWITSVIVVCYIL